MTAASHFRLDGLEPDNLLAFLALLGLLRALEATDRKRPPPKKLYPRAGWDLHRQPLRPILFVAANATREAVIQDAAKGIEVLTATHDFCGRKDLDYSREQCRKLLADQALAARGGEREQVDLLAALMSDGAIKDGKEEAIDPTPLCLLFGQGHQHFLERLVKVPQLASPPPRGRGRDAKSLSASECLTEALFQPWHRHDPTSSFRWDPEEDVRYALMAGDPADNAYKPGTQHGGNRLAAVGLAALSLVPETRAGRVRPSVIGGFSSVGRFSFAWPIWRDPATLSAIQALLTHPRLRDPGATLNHLGVDHVLVAQRLSVGKYMNFSRGRPLAQTGRVRD
jgi:hypothetical protein